MWKWLAHKKSDCNDGVLYRVGVGVYTLHTIGLIMCDDFYRIWHLKHCEEKSFFLYFQKFKCLRWIMLDDRLKKSKKKTKLRDVSYSLNTIDLRKEIFWFVLFFLVFKCGNQFVHFLVQTKKKRHKKLSFKREKFGIKTNPNCRKTKNSQQWTWKLHLK